MDTNAFLNDHKGETDMENNFTYVKKPESIEEQSFEIILDDLKQIRIRSSHWPFDQGWRVHKFGTF